MAGAACLALRDLLSADWCAPGPTRAAAALSSLFPGAASVVACAFLTIAFPPPPFPPRRRPAIYPSAYPDPAARKRYGTLGGRALASEVLSFAPAACAAVGRAARGSGHRLPWCRQLLRELAGAEPGSPVRQAAPVRRAARARLVPPVPPRCKQRNNTMTPARAPCPHPRSSRAKRRRSLSSGSPRPPARAGSARSSCPRGGWIRRTRARATAGAAGGARGPLRMLWATGDL